jgi:hypothetical protein
MEAGIFQSPISVPDQIIQVECAADPAAPFVTHDFQQPSTDRLRRQLCTFDVGRPLAFMPSPAMSAS